jgi:subtilase family serine protease
MLFGLFFCVGGAAPSFAGPSLQKVSTEAVGHADALNDSARPATSATFHLAFALTSASQETIADFVNSLTDPASPNFHKWITPAQFGAKFGASTSDVASVSQYLKAKGFANVKVWPDRLFVSAEAPRSTVESAFGVSIHGYNRSEDQVARGLSATYFAPDQQPNIDQAVAAHLKGVFGLSSAAELLPAGRAADASQPLTSPTGLDPAQMAQVYDISSLHSANLLGQGETIAIFSPTAFQQSDINSFLSLNNIASSNINIVNVDGGTKSYDDQDEACIDIESVVGQAPDAKINVYEGPNNNSFDIFEQVETDNPNILSESYGAEEDTVTASYAASYETIRQAMAAEGITIFVASGDQGAYASIRPLKVGSSVDATSAYVTAVGGTELSTLNNGAWNGETAWTYNDGTLGSDTGSAGGLSIYYAEPSWQTGPGVSNSNSNGMRQIPDVSSLASTPYINIYADGEYSEFGGTSCAAPFWAGAMSLIEQSLGTRLGNIDPTLYAIGANASSSYHDITSGNNGVYSCTTGWDFVTGWGSADFGLLLKAFESYNLPAAPEPTITPDGGSSAAAESVTLADSLSGATIYYTTNGSLPTTSSTVYSGAFNVSSSETITAIAVKSGYSTSVAATAAFEIGMPTPAPKFSLASGTYSAAQTVTISDSNSQAKIYYTTDDTVPTTSSTVYSGAITVSNSETIEAIAVATGYVTSSTITAVYVIGTPVPTPVISPNGGTFPSAQSVTITDTNSSASIYYTTDGTAPTTNSTLYTGAITVSSSETINAIAVAAGYTNSATASAVFTIYSLVPTPVISPSGGTFTSVQSVKITDTLTSATIYYTTDGSTPTTSSPVYSSAILVSQSETVSAIAVVSGYTNSTAAAASFTINLPVVASFPAGLAMFSLPYTYSSDTLASIFGYSGVTLAVWDPLSLSYALTPTSPANEIVAGQGYWVRFPQAVSITAIGTPASTGTSFAVALQPGWNMIGDPFTTSVPLTSLMFAGATFTQATGSSSTLIGPTVYTYNSSTNAYTAASSLDIGVGYWIFAFSAVTMDVPAPN